MGSLGNIRLQKAICGLYWTGDLAARGLIALLELAATRPATLAPPSVNISLARYQTS